MSRPRKIRVIAGRDRGRVLAVPAGDKVRPTKDMVREAVFSALDARGALVDASVLDLYAGSGALAIEALSRGAARAQLVERDRAALDAIRTNIRTLGLDDQARVVEGDVVRLLNGAPGADAPFTLVFADPPYDTSDTVITELLAALDEPGWLSSDAIVVVERPVRHAVAVPNGWRADWERTFGDTLVTFCWK